VSEPDRPAHAGPPDAVRASAHLPGLDIEIIHHRPPAGDAEHIAINLQAMPSFAAFGRSIEAANPFAFWLQAMEVAQVFWTPWLTVASAMMGQGSLPRPLRRVPGRGHPIAPEQEPV
jgi:hypothetical protein